MNTKKKAGRKRGGKKNPKTLDDALFGEHHEKAIFLVMDTRMRMDRIPEFPDPHEEQDRHDWHAFVGRQIVEAILRGDEAAVLLFEGIAKLLKDRRVSKNGDWKKPVDTEWAEAAVIAMKQHDERPEWHLPPMTLDDFNTRRTKEKRKAGDQRRTGGRMARQMGVKIIPAKKGRPKK
jgi:hypothetical protein